MIVRKLAPDQPPLPAEATAAGDGGVSDAYLFTRILSLAADETHHSLTQALGLPREALERLADRHAPALRARIAALPADGGSGEETYEEPDLRAMILEHRARGTEEEEWLAAIVARRCGQANHLWQDMGFAGRGDLGAMFRRHFPSLVAANSGDMKWKKFFYRQLCQREGFLLCKSPNCESCDDHDACFGGEPGAPLKG